MREYRVGQLGIEKERKMLSFLCAQADSFCFSVPQYQEGRELERYRQNITPLLEELRWYALREWNEGETRVYLYRMTAACARILLRHPHLFDWLEPRLPEDLGLILEGRYLLRSITHEQLAWCYLEHELDAAFCREVGLVFSVEITAGEVLTLPQVL